VCNFTFTPPVSWLEASGKAFPVGEVVRIDYRIVDGTCEVLRIRGPREPGDYAE
jgi:hypothetical protein